MVRFELLRVHGNEIFVQIQAPTGDWAELHRKPKERHQTVAGKLRLHPVIALQRRAAEFSVRAGDMGDLPELERDFALLGKVMHRLDRMRRGAEGIATMHQGQALGDRLEIERPVERRVAAADDHDVLVAKILHAAHGVKHRFVFIGVDLGDRRLLRLK